MLHTARDALRYPYDMMDATVTLQSLFIFVCLQEAGCDFRSPMIKVLSKSTEKDGVSKRKDVRPVYTYSFYPCRA